MRIFLSYHTPDRKAAFALKQAIEAQDATHSVFIDQSGLRLGSFWLPKLGEAIRESDAFVILVGNRLGDWQKVEYYEALDRKAKQEHFPIVPVITVERPPNLPFISQLNWIATTEPDAPEPLARLLAAIRGAGIPPAVEPWRTVNPYRGLLALEEEDADFFYGRDLETAEILQAVMSQPDKLIALIGNSGVGKSSLVQAGVVGALKRQRWPKGGAPAAPAWPDALKHSRSWCYLTIKPGADPISALVGAFIALWFEGATNPELIAQRKRWAELLQSGQASLCDLIDATEKRFRDELNISSPPRIFLYIDQGEELYACEPATVAQFSRLLAAGLRDERFVAITTQRSDTYGQLQANDDLFPMTMRIDVASVGVDALRSVLVEPPRIFGARYESPQLVDQILKQAQGQRGALPLVADFMEDLWLEMQRRGDGIIRAFREDRAFFLGGNLIERCELFLQKYVAQEAVIKKLFTQKLIRVYELGEPVAFHLTRSEASDEEWTIVQALASPTWRLVIISEQGGETRAEVMHDVLLRQWPRLQTWVADERNVAIWRTRVESSYQLWRQALRIDKPTLLLGEYVLNEIMTDDLSCKFALHKGLAEFIHASARRRSSWWQSLFAYYRETFSGLNLKRILIALALYFGGVVAIVSVTLPLLIAKLIDVDQYNVLNGAAGMVLGVGLVIFLFRSPRRSRFARLARNLRREFGLVPTGVGGWLLLIVLFLFLVEIATPFEIITSAPTFRGNLADAVTAGSPTRWFSTVQAILYVVNFGIFILGIITLFAIFQRSPSAPRLTICLFAAALVVGILEPLVKFWAADPTFSPTEDVITAVIGSAFAIVVILYFQRSKRVRARFMRAG